MSKSRSGKKCFKVRYERIVKFRGWLTVTAEDAKRAVALAKHRPVLLDNRHRGSETVSIDHVYFTTRELSL